jgi:hypothetical protein
VEQQEQQRDQVSLHARKDAVQRRLQKQQLEEAGRETPAAAKARHLDVLQ